MRISPGSGVVGEGRPAAGSIQSTASTSSLKRGSPLVHRATNEAMTKYVRNSAPLGEIASTCPVKGDDFGLDANFFHELPAERGHCLADFDAPAGRAEMAEQRRPRSAHDEHPALSKHRSRNREDGGVRGITGHSWVIFPPSPRPSISSGDRSQCPQQRSALELDAPREKRLPHPKSEKQILQHLIYKYQKHVLYLCLSPGSSPLVATAGRKGKGVRRFDPGLGRGRKFLFQTAITH
jgi:hypothetical protein